MRPKEEAITETSTWREHSGPIADPAAASTVIECDGCGFRHVVPLPTDDELEARYRSRYYSEDKPLYFDRMKEDAEWWRMVYGERFDHYERLLPPDRRRILDIGAGTGAFLEHGMARGWDVLGIEPGKQAAEHIRSLGAEVVEAFFTPRSAPNLGTFDVIHMSTVLEHVPDPAGLVRLCRQILTSGGLLDIAVPNDYNLLQLLLVEHFDFAPWWVVPAHINYFTQQSAETLLTSSGFCVVNKTLSFPIELFVLMGDNYIGDDVVGRATFGRIKNLELALAQSGMASLKSTLYETFAGHDLGREIQMLAVADKPAGR